MTGSRANLSAAASAVQARQQRRVPCRAPTTGWCCLYSGLVDSRRQWVTHHMHQMQAPALLSEFDGGRLISMHVIFVVFHLFEDRFPDSGHARIVLK